MARTLSVLGEFRTIMEREAVIDARLVATSAVRDAENGAEFLSAAAAETGARTEVLSGVEEGRLSYGGATAGLPPHPSLTAVLDIGGGSTELIVELDDEIHAFSMELGCVRLTERYLSHDPPLASERAGAVQEIGAELDRALEATPAFRAIGPDSRLIGLAGTVSTLAALELGLTEYRRDLIHHFSLSAVKVEHWCDVLGGETSDARAKRPGMTEGRQDVIVGGAMVLREVMTRFGISNCLVSESDILDGLVATMREGRD
jgi:exopolyphosphatase/guanosine-5'-triphosphate,3'-diphosphate pyrophosphatase